MFLFVRRMILSLVALALVSVAHGASKAELERRLISVENRLARIEKLLDNQVLIDMLQRLEALQREMQLLRGDSERSIHELDMIKTRQRELYLDIDQRLQGLESGGRAQVSRPPSTAQVPLKQSASGTTGSSRGSVPPVATAGTGTSVAPTPNIATNGAARDAYKRAFNILKEGRYEHAIGAFRTFLSEYSGSAYAANAQYWLAEANYVSRNFPEALVEFKKVLESYPSSSKVPDATLKLGYTHYELDNWNEAREILTGLRNEHPNSSVARLADQRLKRMKREGH